jgi:hypothetical protein
MDVTKWKPIHDYEGLYEVSNYGSVRSIDRIIVKRGFDYLYKGKILSKSYDKDGYCKYVLSKSNKQKTFRACQLVCSHFVQTRPAGLICRHKDGNKLNDHYLNLEWGTHQENTNDRLDHGTMLYGEDVPTSKLTWEQVHDIRNSLASRRELSLRYNVSVSTIEKVLNNVYWKV